MIIDKKHEVRADVRMLELSKAGSAIRLKVFADGKKLGEIEIGHGSFGWKKANSKRDFQRRDWTTFTEWLNETLY